MVTALIVIAALVVGCRGFGRVILGTREAPAGSGAMPPVVTAITGLALLTWLAGWLVVAGVYSETSASLLLTAGIAAWFLRGPKPGEPRAADRRRPPGQWDGIAVLLAGVALVLGLMRITGDLAINALSACADLAAYLHFPRLMLESGSFIEPFNFRRLGTLGAAPLLQGYLWPYFYTAAPLVTDATIGQLLVWAAARELPALLSGRVPPPWVRESFGLGALLVAYTLPMGNSLPVFLTMGGGLVLLMLTRNLVLATSPRAGLRTAIAWGLVAAWLVALRTSIAPFPALLWLGCLLWVPWATGPRLIPRLAMAGVVSLLALLPWGIALWQSSGTPLFPLLPGNYRSGSVLPASPDLSGALAFVGDCLWQSRVWVLAGLALIVALRPRGRLAALGVGAVLVGLVAVTGLAMTGFDPATVHRYTAPLLGAGLVFLAALALPVAREVSSSRWLRPGAFVAVLALWAVMPVPKRPGDNGAVMSNLFRLQVNLRSSAHDALATATSGLAIPIAAAAGEYQEAQARLPPGAKVLVAADLPFYFRFDQQTLHTIDLPGEVSPDPGMPFFAGREPLAIYLRGLGYTHLAFTPSAVSTCLYSADTWSSSPDPATPIARRRAPYSLDFITNAELLTRTYPAVYAGRSLVVLDLGNGPAALDAPR